MSKNSKGLLQKVEKHATISAHKKSPGFPPKIFFFLRFFRNVLKTFAYTPLLFSFTLHFNIEIRIFMAIKITMINGGNVTHAMNIQALILFFLSE